MERSEIHRQSKKIMKLQPNSSFVHIYIHTYVYVPLYSYLHIKAYAVLVCPVEEKLKCVRFYLPREP